MFAAKTLSSVSWPEPAVKLRGMKRPFWSSACVTKTIVRPCSWNA
jgi:hypothetical protein